MRVNSEDTDVCVFSAPLSHHPGHCLSYMHQLTSVPIVSHILRLGLPLKVHSENIPRNRLRTVFVIPRKKVIPSRNSVCLKVAHSKEQNYMKKSFIKMSFEFVPLSLNGSKCLSKSFFLSLNGLERGFVSAKWFGTEF
jgi:hypothetical protein